MVKNVVTGVLLGLIGAGTLWATAGFPRGLAAAADPALLPRSLAVMLMVIGVLLVASTLLLNRSGAATGDDADGIPMELPVDVPDELLHDEDEGPPETRIVAVLGALLFLYAWAAFNIGFIVSTSGLIIAAALLLGRSRHVRALLSLVIFAVVAAGVVYIGFFELLNVRPPTTPLP